MPMAAKHGNLKNDGALNIEKAKILPLLSRKLDKYEYLTSEEILPSDQRRVLQ